MSTRTRSPLIAALKALVPLSEEPDEVLLNRFLADRADEPFHAIVRRHGGLVLDVCRSILRNDADAEDAFQATFLILATRARSVRNPAALAAWLHGTAYRTAQKARTAATRRRAVESSVPPNASVPASDPTWTEVREAIHEEVNRLPERERAAVVLCYLTGVTQEAAATALALTRDGVKKRLERGRDLLRGALTNRGFGPVAVLAGTVMMPAAAPAALTASTTALVIGVSTGALAPGAIPSGVRSLLEGGTGMTTAIKLTAAMAILAVVTAFGFATPPTNELPSKPAASREAAKAPGEPQPAETSTTELDGTWKLVSVSDRGKDVPGVPAIEFRFREGKLELPSFDTKRDGGAWDPSFLRGAKLRHDPTVNQHTIDFELAADVAKDVTLPGIYKIQDGHLKIAVRTLKTAGLPRPTGFLTPSGALVTLTLEPTFTSPRDALNVMAAPTDRGVVIFEFGRPKKPLHTIKLPARAVLLRFSDDGKYLAAVCSDRRIIIWTLSGKAAALTVTETQRIAFQADPAKVNVVFCKPDEAMVLGLGDVSLTIKLP